MQAIMAEWGGDLQIGPGGDVLTVPAESEIRQRVLRRLLTNQGDYIWWAEYGAGLGGFVGSPFVSVVVRDMITTQLKFEQLIAQSPPPDVSVGEALSSDRGVVPVTISFRLRGGPEQQTLAVNLSSGQSHEPPSP